MKVIIEYWLLYFCSNPKRTISETTALGGKLWQEQLSNFWKMTKSEWMYKGSQLAEKAWKPFLSDCKWSMTEAVGKAWKPVFLGIHTKNRACIRKPMICKHRIGGCHANVLWNLGLHGRCSVGFVLITAANSQSPILGILSPYFLQIFFFYICLVCLSVIFTPVFWGTQAYRYS